MRRIPTLLRFVGSGCGALTLALLLPAMVTAQEAGAKPATAAGPLSRYVPRDGLALYIEFAGLDLHGDAWRKTAAYKMLNETTLGAMLEDLTAQLAERDVSRRADRRVNGTEVVKMIEHIARNGFVVASNAKPGDTEAESEVMVLRGAASKDVRAMFSRLMFTLGGPNAKPELSKLESGTQVVLMNGEKAGSKWAWWPEKDDLLITPQGLKGAQIIAEVLAGKRPNATEHPVRLELVKADNGMEPVGVGFLEAANFPAHPSQSLVMQMRQVGASRVDFRWGPSGDALVTIVGLKAPKPRRGILAVLDQPTFDTKKLLPMPEGINEFSAFSLSGGKAYDSLAELAKVAPPFGAAFDNLVETMKTKGRLDLRKDIMAHLGPRMVLYSPHGAAAATTKAAAAAPTTEPAKAAGPLASLLGGMVTVPRYVLLMEVDDAKAFERSLDSAMILANRSIRAYFASKAAEAAPAQPAGQPEGGEAAPGEPAKKRAGDGPAPEFRMMPGPTKSYVLNIPSGLGALPAGLRPTIRMGTKHVVIATSPELARQALEIKPGTAWAPAAESAAALEQVPPGLIYLQLDDPREKMPQMLASFPGELQKSINTALASAKAPAAGAGGAPGTGSPSEAARSNSGPSVPGSSSSYSSGSATPQPGASSGYGSTPGGQPGTEGAKADETVVLNVDPAKLPSANALKALLFPGTTSVATTDDEVRYVRREAFPDLGGTMLNSQFLKTLAPRLTRVPEGAATTATAQPATPGAAGAPAGSSGAAAAGGAPPGSSGAAAAGGAPPGSSGNARSRESERPRE